MEKLVMILMFFITLAAMGIIAHAFKSDFENSLGNIGVYENDRNFLLREKRANNKRRGGNKRNNQKKNSNRGSENRGGEQASNRGSDYGEGEEPPKQ